MSRKKDLEEERDLLRQINNLRAKQGKTLLSEQGLGKTGKSIKGLTNMLDKLKQKQEEINILAGEFGDIAKENLDELGKQASYQSQYISGQRKLVDLSEKLKDDASEINDLGLKQLRTMEAQARREQRKRQAILDGLKKEQSEKGKLSKLDKKLLDQMENELNLQDQAVKKIEERIKKEKEYIKNLGLTGQMFKGLESALGKIGIESGHFETMNRNMRTASKEGGRFSVMLAGLKGLAQGFGDALDDPVVLMGVLFKTAKFLYDIFNGHMKEVAAVGNLYGVAGAQAEHMTHQIKMASQAGGEMQYTFDEILKAQNLMNKATGQNLKINKEQAQFMSMLVDDMGVSEQSAMKTFLISKQTGKSQEQIVDQVLAQNVELNKATGTAMNFNDVMNQIGGMSDTMLVNFQGNTKAMIQAAHTAQRLGMTMDQIANSSRQTLDFESSIQKEIEAEMFLQKDLNLAKLREATLAGDAKTMAAEQERLVRENFAATKGNVMMQEKMAAVLGLSHDEYMKIGNRLEHEQKIGAAGVAQEKKKARELAEQAQKQDEINKAFSAAVVQLKEALLPVVKALGPAFSGFAKMVGTFFASPVGKTIATLGGLAVGGALVFKAGKSVLSLFGLGGGRKPTGSAMDPIHTVQGTGMTDMMGKFFSRNNKFARMLSKPLKGLSKVFGGKKTMVGRFFRGQAAKTLGSTGQFFKGKVPQFGPKMAPRMPAGGPGSKIFGGVSKGLKGFTKGLGGVVKKLGPIGAVLDLGLGGFTGASQADMSAEEQKAAGVEVGISKGKAATLGVLTGGAEKGSMFSGALGIEKGSAADEAMGIAGAGARGAAIGATIGSVIPVVGTAVGGVVGGVVGAGAEAVKVFTDPNSALRKKVSEFGASVKEKAGQAFDFLKEKGGQAYEGLKKGAGAWWSFQKKGLSKVWEFGKKGLSGLVGGAKKLMSGAKSIASKAYSGAKSLASKAYAGVKSVGSSIAGFFGFEKGGIVPGGFKAFQNGGIVDKPTVGLVGEGAMNEAVVPLPDGKNIPVNLSTQKLESLLQQLINLTAKGSTVVMDGAIVGKKIASSTSELGS